MNEIITPDEREVNLHFPGAGVDTSQAFAVQPNRPAFNGAYQRTSYDAQNVRAFDAAGNRLRGGSRPGLERHIDDIPGDVAWIIQDLASVIGANDMQYSQSGRVVTLVAVVAGNVYYVVAGDTSWTLATNNTAETPPLNISGVVFSTPSQQKLYFADGINWAYYVPLTNTVETWAATAGTLPVDSDNNTPRLICTWRGRIVVSGLIKDPQVWFMSKVDDPYNWDYDPVSPSSIDAVAGNNSPLGTVGDMITALIPATDDVLIFGGDSSIWVMRGDPLAGGQIDLVSNTIGIAWGKAWCMDPLGNIFFCSNRMGVYVMSPGGQPQRVSQQIEQALATINSGTHSIRLLWDDFYQGFHMFVTPLDEPAASTHWFWEQRTGGWTKTVFANNDHSPIACCTFDGNLPTDRVPIIGSWDGYVRHFTASNTTDDGETITSYVWIGPLLTKDMDALLMKDLQCVLGDNSGAVTYEVYTGATAELALASTAIASGTWTEGRNFTNLVRASGHALYVKLSSTNQWAMEQIRVRMQGQGRVARRGLLT